MDRLNEIIAKKTRHPKQGIKDASKTFCWKWITAAKSQQKTLPKLNALDCEDHYQQIQRDVRTTARKNPALDNYVLRLRVDVRVISDDGPSTVEENDDTTITERLVVLNLK